MESRVGCAGSSPTVAELIDQLSRVEAFPVAVDEVRVVQTHSSVVFLGGDLAYKVKKPVDLGFLDFSTSDRRLTDCHAEVSLNRRLAPGVYHGVVAVTCRDGLLSFEGDGEVVEHAVRMRRLPDAARFSERLAAGSLAESHLTRLAERLAAFHATAESGPEVVANAEPQRVAAAFRQNLTETDPFIGTTLRRPLRAKLATWMDAELERLGGVMADRARRGLPRDTHGDLRLEHVYLLDDRSAPDDLVVVDCLEFDEKLRHADPVADVAFLVMDLEANGRPDLASNFADAWFAAAGDEEARALLPLHVAHRHVVRGKVDSLVADDPDVPWRQRGRARRKATAHFCRALGKLAPPEERPGLVLVSGLPGTGKTTLARALSEAGRFEHVSSDIVRKRLAGLSPVTSAASEYQRGLYDQDWTDRTYGACLALAQDALLDGRRVVVDATFADESRRRTFLAAARDLGVPALIFRCEAPEAVARERLSQRRGDASDAGWAIHVAVRRAWQEDSETTAAVTRCFDTSQPVAEARDRALVTLSDASLWRTPAGEP